MGKRELHFFFHSDGFNTEICIIHTFKLIYLSHFLKLVIVVYEVYVDMYVTIDMFVQPISRYSLVNKAYELYEGQII